MGLEEALKKAIEYLQVYANDDEMAGLNGSGCYSNPQAEVELMIDEIRKLEKE